MGATVTGGGAFDTVAAGTALEGKGVVAGGGAGVGTGATAGAGVDGDEGFVARGVWLNTEAEKTAKSSVNGSDLNMETLKSKNGNVQGTLFLSGPTAQKPLGAGAAAILAGAEAAASLTGAVAYLTGAAALHHRLPALHTSLFLIEW